MRYQQIVTRFLFIILGITCILYTLLPGKTMAGSSSSESNPEAATTTIQIEANAPGKAVSPLVLGTNLPAWLNPNRFKDSIFQARSIALGTPMVRMPGGSWSNYYDWLSCENSGPCPWTWGVSRPTDFIDYLQATGLQGMWTANMNGTAKEAAALVAFFNGSVNDHRLIGIDVKGQDWGKVSKWAQLRADHGNPDPINIRYWEIGNEIYGGKPNMGKDCTAWGWEDVWTCDGREYVLGIGSGTNRKQGYLEFREAMRFVDPSILVGAVGVSNQNGWSNWGNEVIEEAGDVMDLYVIHEYGYFNPPAGYAEVLARPQALWQPMMADVRAAFDQYAGGREVPVAVTEHNLFSVESMDPNYWMSRAVNGMYVADTLGQLIQHGFAIANQWDIAHQEWNNPPGYGLMQATTYFRSPQYYAMHIWSRFGDELLPVTWSLPPASTLSLYAGRANPGLVTLLAINKTANPIAAQVSLNGVEAVACGEVHTIKATTLADMQVTYNGLSDPPTNLDAAAPTPLAASSNPFNYTFVPYSITLLRIQVSIARDLYFPLIVR